MKIVSTIAWLLVSSLATPASSLISCVRAARSSNDGAFVIFEEQLGPIKDRPPEEHRVLRMTYEIFPLRGQEFNYPENKLTVPMTFWEDSTAPWEVVFEPNDGRPLPACPIPIVSNDAEYLILLAQDQRAAPDSIAMQIYKRPSQTQLGTEWAPRGNLVRTLTLKELWPGIQVPAREPPHHRRNAFVVCRSNI